MNFSLFIISILIVSSHSRPQETRIIFPDELEEIAEKTIETELPARLYTEETNDLEGPIEASNSSESLEYGKYFQGDMRLTSEQEKFYTQNATDEDDDDEEIGMKTGLINAKYRWPKYTDGNVYVPFIFSRNSWFSTAHKNMVIRAMNYIGKYTCIGFTYRSNQADYVKIINGEECSSYIGKIGGEQVLSLDTNGCFSNYGTIIHELIHALGYDHMHNHADRDKFVTILWENIRDGEESNFHRVDSRKYSNFGTAYDYKSVMHYNSKAFSWNQKDTIIPKDKRYKGVIGYRSGMSDGDVQRINKMYNCRK